MARTDATQVQAVLLADYDGSSSLSRFITSANLIVTRVAACALTKGITLSSEELTEIESWLAAHLYTRSDKVLKSKSTLSASGSFSTGKNDTPYLDGATALDPSGCLLALMNNQVAGGFYAGRGPAEQTDYEDREM